MTARHILLLGVFGICSAAMTGCQTAESQWQEALRRNTPESYRTFMAENPGHLRSSEAKKRLEAVEFARARRVDTITAYENFIRNHPAGHLADQAKERLLFRGMEEEQFLSVQNDGSLTNLAHFLLKYGDNTLSARRWEARDVFIKKIHAVGQAGGVDEIRSIAQLLEMYVKKVEGKPEYLVGEAGGVIALGATSFDGGIRLALVAALGDIEDANAAVIPLLIGCLADPERSITLYGMNLSGPTSPKAYDYPVRKAALLALKKITGINAGKSEGEWRAWWRGNAAGRNRIPADARRRNMSAFLEANRETRVIKEGGYGWSGERTVVSAPSCLQLAVKASERDKLVINGKIETPTVDFPAIESMVPLRLPARLNGLGDLDKLHMSVAVGRDRNTLALCLRLGIARQPRGIYLALDTGSRLLSFRLPEGLISKALAGYAVDGEFMESSRLKSRVRMAANEAVPREYEISIPRELCGDAATNSMVNVGISVRMEEQ